uniref:Uncharacterized protein n=1 Tax=Rhizophora mucronata TaxID=61149 RepID=A0A2P2NAY5_RHIMU
MEPISLQSQLFLLNFQM